MVVQPLLKRWPCVRWPCSYYRTPVEVFAWAAEPIFVLVDDLALRHGELSSYFRPPFLPLCVESRVSQCLGLSPPCLQGRYI